VTLLKWRCLNSWKPFRAPPAVVSHALYVWDGSGVIHHCSIVSLRAGA
jgi:hypothetical protein